MARPLPALITALAAALAAAPDASAHSLVRVVGAEALYLSQDATSLNTLTVRPAGGEIEFHDPTVDGGADPGPCRPGEVSSDGLPIQVFCPASGLTRVRVDLADREDTATIAPGIPTDVLAGSGAVLHHRLPPSARVWTALAGNALVLALAVRMALAA